MILRVSESLSLNSAPDEAGRREQAIKHIGYFSDWGGRPWRELCRYALCQLGDLKGKRVLDVGMRNGKMSSLFALMGAEVVGLDIDQAVIKSAQQEAEKWGVSDRTTFYHYNGDLKFLKDLDGQTFDVIFTKSVLVRLGEQLTVFLNQLHSYLSSSGSCLFLENARGNHFFSAMRKIRPRSRRYADQVTYFSKKQLQAVRDVFNVSELKVKKWPPIYLIRAGKKTCEGVVA